MEDIDFKVRIDTKDKEKKKKKKKECSFLLLKKKGEF